MKDELLKAYKETMARNERVKECMETLFIISQDPIDKKLLKQELKDEYTDDEIKQAKRLLKEKLK